MKDKSKNVLYIEKITSDAYTPTKGSKYAAGYDLYSMYNVDIPPNDKADIETNIKFKFPKGCYGRIAPRSGLAFKHYIIVLAGVIDRDFTGSVKVALFNLHSTQKYSVKRGDRVAQLICEKIRYPDIKEVEKIDFITDRGDDGFGSTGK